MARIDFREGFFHPWHPRHPWFLLRIIRGISQKAQSSSACLSFHLCAFAFESGFPRLFLAPLFHRDDGHEHGAVVARDFPEIGAIDRRGFAFYLGQQAG